MAERDEADRDDAQRWKWLDHLLTIEHHWTEQVQNQQQRNAAILTVNGVLLGFLGTTGVSASISPRTSTAWFLAGGLVALALALFAGLIGLWPRIPISRNEDSWLDLERQLRSLKKRPPTHAIEAICDSLVSAYKRADYKTVLKWRRQWMYWELALMSIGLLLLVASWLLFLVP